MCTCIHMDVITCNTKIKCSFLLQKACHMLNYFPRENIILRVLILPLTMWRFGTWSTFLCFSFLACDSRKTSALLGLAVVSLRELIVLKLNRLKGLYFCEVVTALSALIKCFICTSLMAFTLSTLLFWCLYTCFISSWAQGIWFYLYI